METGVVVENEWYCEQHIPLPVQKTKVMTQKIEGFFSIGGSIEPFKCTSTP